MGSKNLHNAQTRKEQKYENVDSETDSPVVYLCLNNVIINNFHQIIYGI